MRKPLVKICGITRLPDALAAIDAGADMLGLIFAPASPRKIDPAMAADLARAIRQERPESCVQLVGVFQNAPLVEMEEVIETVGLDLAQLHGDEPPEVCAALPVPVIRVLVAHNGLSTEAWLERLHPYEADAMPNLRAFLLDLPKGAPGGDIRSLTLPPPVLERLRERDFLLAGGLNPDNVQEAVRMFRPSGVDVASGVEQSPGQKDIGKVHAFCHNVADIECSPVTLPLHTPKA